MSPSEPARIAAGRIHSVLLAALALLGVALIGGVAWQAAGHAFGSSSFLAASSMDTSPGNGDHLGGRHRRGEDQRHRPPAPPRSSRSTGGSEADGAVPGGLTVFDNHRPAVTNLAPVLLRALRHAAMDAGRIGVDIVVTSGWRSRGLQKELLRQAVATYGSERAAARWVASPETSAHVSGDAVDIGPSRAAAWLSRHGAGYGLCQIYKNEPWHYELRPDAVDDGCPAMYADPRYDPRMQR